MQKAQIRKSFLTGAIVAAAALVAGAAGAQTATSAASAQTFDQTVNDTLKKDGVLSQVSGQKQISAQDPDMIDEALKPGPGRGNPGHGNPGHGNPGHGNPGHGNPGHGHGGDRHDGGRHEGRNGPAHRPDWHGHGGGWGDHYHGHYGWHWDYWNRPLWLGWIIWNGVGICSDWYLGRRAGCYADCRVEADSCLASGADPVLCNDTELDCTASCNYQYDVVWYPRWHYCPL